MSSTISSSYMSMHRPDPAQLASKLFSKLDTKNQGYLEKSDLQTAMQSISGSSDNSNVDELFSQLDSNSDGKVTKDEMSSTLSKLAEQLDSQFNQMRMQDGMQQGMGAAGGMPPPPPQGGGQDDAGFTKDELSSQLEEIGSSDSERSSLISNIVNNFEAADTDGDGKVSFKEAMAYDQKTSSNSSSSDTSSSASSTSASSSASSNSELKLMQQIMRLMHAYGGNDSTSASSSALSSLISTNA